MKNLSLLCASLIGFALITYTVASLYARDGVFDDVVGIMGIPFGIPEGGLLDRLVLEWTNSTYDVATAGQAYNYVPWGPLTATMWDVLAVAVGRDSIIPFRLLNVAVFAFLLMGVFRAVSRVSGVELAGWIAAAAVAVHPLTVETVAWSSDLFDLLGATILVWGFYTLSFCRATWQVALVTITFTLFAGFAKPTATINGLYYPIVLICLCREKHWVVVSGIVAVGTMVGHQILYSAITSGVEPVAVQALAITLSDAEHGIAFLVQLGVQVVQLVTGVGPRTFRMVYAPDSWAPPVALTGYGWVLYACFTVTIFAAKNVLSKRSCLLFLAVFALWVCGNVPGALFAMQSNYIGVRYCFMPAVCTIVCLAILFAGLPAQLSILTRPVYAITITIVTALGLLSWGNVSLERLPVWQAEGTYLEEELRLAAEWQRNGEPHPEFEANFHFLRLLAYSQGREARLPDVCAHLAAWERATDKMEKEGGDLIHIRNTMERPRKLLWEEAFSHGTCTNLDPRMRQRLLRNDVRIPMLH